VGVALSIERQPMEKQLLVHRTFPKRKTVYLSLQKQNGHYAGPWVSINEIYVKENFIEY